MGAEGNLSGAQFAAMYPAGHHNVPIEHVWAIRDKEAVDDPRSDPDISKGIRNPLDVVSMHGSAWLEDGHHRLRKARTEGHTHVPVKVWDEDAIAKDLEGLH